MGRFVFFLFAFARDPIYEHFSKGLKANPVYYDAQWYPFSPLFGIGSSINLFNAKRASVNRTAFFTIVGCWAPSLGYDLVGFCGMALRKAGKLTQATLTHFAVPLCTQAALALEDLRLAWSDLRLIVDGADKASDTFKQEAPVASERDKASATFKQEAPIPQKPHVCTLIDPALS